MLLSPWLFSLHSKWCGNFRDHRRDWNCVHEVFVCSLDVSLWDKNLNIQTKTHFIVIGGKEVGLVVDVEKTKYIRNSCLFTRLQDSTIACKQVISFFQNVITLRPDLQHRHSHVPANSQSNIYHCVWTEVCALLITFQIRLHKGKECFPGPWAYPYWEFSLTNQNYSYEETRSRLKSVDFGHHSVQNLLSSCVLSKNIMIGYTKVMFCPAVLMGVKLGLLH